MYTWTPAYRQMVGFQYAFFDISFAVTQAASEFWNSVARVGLRQIKFIATEGIAGHRKGAMHIGRHGIAWYAWRLENSAAIFRHMRNRGRNPPSASRL